MAERSEGRLAGKVAFVTGAAQGQGRSHVVRLAEEGANIVAVDLQDPSAAGGVNEFAATVELVRNCGGEILARQCDVRDGARLAEIAAEGHARFGRLDIVVANAGIIAAPSRFLDASFAELQRSIDINLYGVWHTCKATVPYLIAGERGGSVIITSSLLGLKAFATSAGYAASKHAVVGFMRSLALDLGPHRIRVNSLHPTTVDTPMLRALQPVGVSQEENAERLISMHALPVPWIDAVDVSHAVVYLASDESRYITGVTLPVDAGAMMMGPPRGR